jgi:MYXO-CTERM domain-containing protein
MSFKVLPRGLFVSINPERILKMMVRQKLLSSLALLLLTTPASAGVLTYVVTGNQQFGAVDLATGAFTQIGPNTPQEEAGLVPGPNGSLLTLTFSGDLDSINPATGLFSLIGATGLADCSNFPVSPCGPTSANDLAIYKGTIYATDISNNLYTVNPLTAATTLIGPTGIPAVPAIPDSGNSDGTFNAFDESLFSAGGNLYATFDAIKLDPSPFSVTPVISPALYEINPVTGRATFIATTALTIGAVVDVNGTSYAFNNMAGQVATLDLTNGNTTAISNFPPDGGLLVEGASPTPEPASFFLAAIALGGILVLRRRHCRSATN